MYSQVLGDVSYISDLPANNLHSVNGPKLPGKSDWFSTGEALKSLRFPLRQTASFVHLSAGFSTEKVVFFCPLKRPIGAHFDVKCLTKRGWEKIMDIA